MGSLDFDVSKDVTEEERVVHGATSSNRGFNGISSHLQFSSHRHESVFFFQVLLSTLFIKLGASLK